MACVGEDVEILEPLYTAGGDVKWYLTLEKNPEVPQKAEIELLGTQQMHP